MSFYKVTFYAGIAALILMAVSSGTMNHLQRWVTHYSANHYSVTPEKRSSSQMLHRTSGSIKLVSSTQLTVQKAPKNQAQENRQKPAKSSNSFVGIEQVTKTNPNPKLIATQPFIKTSVSPAPAIALLASMEPQSLSLPINEQPASLPELVMYPDEMVIVFPQKIASTENIQKVVSRVLLSHAPLSETNLLKTQPIDLKQRPYFYRRVLDQRQAPIRYPMQAFNYADYLIEHHTEEHQDEAGRYITLHIPLVEYGITGPAKNYQAWVENYAKEFKIPPSLVYAVMETESAFDPNAVSRSNAIGLMQVKADAAGKDVYKLIDKKTGYPSAQALFDPQENIRVGVGYMGLLKNKYLKRVQNPKSREMLLISAYNGGLSKALQLFGKTPETAIARINQLHPKNIYRTLKNQHESDETRRYLDKVLAGKEKFTQIILSSA